MQRLDARDAGFAAAFTALVEARRESDADVAADVAAIIADVRTRGDAALFALTAKFDRIDLAATGIEVSAADIAAARAQVPAETLAALELAANRIRAFHAAQRPADHDATDAAGVRAGYRWSAVEAAGLYVPGGLASYPSSVLMNAIPAKVAGVERLVMVTPTPNGRLNPLVLVAAELAGVDKVYRIGGAQAVAALAYGTQTIPQVDKIVGPGNAYVAEAKRRVFGTVGIDMVAGPSEVLIISDGSGHADWVAMDLFAQAEHDELAQSILLCTDAGFIDAVHEAIDRLLPTMPRRDTIAKSLANRGALIHVDSVAQACAIANRIAPEHLELSLDDAEAWIDHIRHAGAIFVGHWAVEALGDYCAGPNHVLPTMRSARFSSPLGTYDFQKRTSIVNISQAGAQHLGKVASILAHGEGLQAHARSAEMRLKI